MLSVAWKERLLKVPGAKQVKDHLKVQGHTDEEAELGGLITSGLVIFLLYLLFNGFVFGLIRTFFNNFWNYCAENPTTGLYIGLFGTILFLAIFFRYLNKNSEQKKEKQMEERFDKHRAHEQKLHLQKGAMGNFEEVFRRSLSEKYPEIEIKTIHVIDTTPRVRIQARRFNTEFGGKVDKNYELFRDTLLSDTHHVIKTTMELSENIPAVIVDAMMSFIKGNAKYYDGAVLSVKAKRGVYQSVDMKTPSFKALSAFDIRYNDGMEVQVLPEEESKTARIIERIKEKAPQIDVRYESAKEKVDEGWEKPVPKAVEKLTAIDTIRTRELSTMPLAEFQDMVLGLLSKLGFDVQKIKKIPGGTLQIAADFSHPVIGGNFTVLARQYPESAQVHADLVRELDELTREEACKRGLYFVTAEFTEEAKNITRKLAVDLVGGQKLSELLAGPRYEGRWTFRIVDETGVTSDLSKMSLMDFEKEVDFFLKSMGFRVTKIRRAPGGNVIAVAEHPHPVTGGKFAVMGKQFPADTRVPAELVSEFTHIMSQEFCFRGLLLVPADFAMDARALSRFSGVELVDRNLWSNLRRQLGKGG